MDAPTRRDPSRPGPGEGVRERGKPIPEGEEGSWKRKRSRPLTPSGLVGLAGSGILLCMRDVQKAFVVLAWLPSLSGGLEHTGVLRPVVPPTCCCGDHKLLLAK